MAGAAFKCVTSTALREHREISGALPVDQGFGQFHEPKKRGRISSRKRSARQAQRHERPSDRPAEFRQKNKNTHTQPSQSEIAGDPGRRSVKAQPSKRASNLEREREARVFLPTQEDRVGLGWEAQRNAVRSPPSCSPAVWESPAPAPAAPHDARSAQGTPLSLPRWIVQRKFSPYPPLPTLSYSPFSLLQLHLLVLPILVVALAFVHFPLPTHSLSRFVPPPFLLSLPLPYRVSVRVTLSHLFASKHDHTSRTLQKVPRRLLLSNTAIQS